MFGQDIITRANDLTNDDGTKWTPAEDVRWINDGCMLLCIVRPDSCSVRGPIALVAGALQSLPAGGLRLMDVLHNTTGGRRVKFIEREQLDAVDPSWRAATASSVIKNYVYDSRDPTHFETYPPAAAGASVQAIYVSKPVLVTVGNVATQVLTPDDTFIEPLTNYVVFRRYSKDAAFGAADVAAGYRSLVEQMLGVKQDKDGKSGPDWNNPGGVPSAAQQQGGV
jgi:hypothetical protein